MQKPSRICRKQLAAQLSKSPLSFLNNTRIEHSYLRDVVEKVTSLTGEWDSLNPLDDYQVVITTTGSGLIDWYTTRVRQEGDQLVLRHHSGSEKETSIAECLEHSPLVIEVIATLGEIQWVVTDTHAHELYAPFVYAVCVKTSLEAGGEPYPAVRLKRRKQTVVQPSRRGGIL